MSQEPTLRASDDDREVVVRDLRAHCSAGRLTVEELEERSAAAYAALTLGDLAALVSDLPSPGPAPQVPAGLAVPGPDEHSPAQRGDGDRVDRVSATFGSTEKAGVWQVPRHLVARATLGECKIDLRRAELPDELDIHARAILGEVRIYVPADARVEMTGRSFIATKRVRGTTAGPADGPRIRVHVNAVLGEVTVDVATKREKLLDAARAWRGE